MSPARIALALGLLGLVPFAGFGIAAWLTPNIGLRFTFLRQDTVGGDHLVLHGGCPLGFTLTQPSPDPWRVMAFGLVPALALAAPFLPIGWAALLLASGFIGLLASELTPSARHKAPEWYPPLRIS